MLSFLFLSCCSRDGEECPPDFTGQLNAEEEKLIGTWLLSNIESSKMIDLTDDNTDNPSNQLFEQYTECQRDATYDFHANRTYIYRLGITAENCEHSLESEGSWALTAQELKLASSCSLLQSGIKFSDDGLQFMFTEIYNIRDVNGAVIQTKLEITYQRTNNPQ